MENGGILYGDGNDLMALLHNPNWVSSPSPSPCFHENMVNFDQVPHQGKRASMIREYDDNDEDNNSNGGEELELNPCQPEKKRRLSPEQVEFLERSFEVENKLEPERKVELAKQVGLKPRQVAIWYQNRRARYKTKLLERDYASLKANYDRLKLDFESLSKDRDSLQFEVMALTKKINERDGAQNITPMNQPSTNILIVPSTTCNKQSVEESSSAKSDIVDSGSPYYAERNHSSLADDPTDQQSDFSQEDEHMMMNGMVLLPSIPPPSLPDFTNLLKVEESECYEPIFTSSCNFSLVDDQPHLWSFNLHYN